MRRDEQGVTHVIEYTLALTLFIMLLHSFTTTMEFRLGVDLDRQDQRYPAVREVLGELTGSVGNASGVEVWETLEWGTGETQLRNGTIVGLLASDGVLSEAKCQALAKFPYGGLREELGVNEELAIEVRTLSPDAQVIFWGGDLDSASISVTEERLLLLRTTGGDEVPAKLRVSLFEAPFVSDSLYLTEIMYAPTSGTEWIELYNPHDTAIMLSGWKLSDLEEDDLITGTATEQLSIPARTAAVIASNPTIFASDYPSVS
ncbi:MAG: lamin tail domain-containing protein, partial [Candidatus Thermoplasmatota archaeon]|nr:lamin tail domain-containing protein [Candidatus Thermoplasmatota archaeon]